MIPGGRGRALAALFLAALTLRPQIVGVGPLLPAIQDDLDAPHAVVGLLATIPVLCMGLFAPPAPYLTGRVGTRVAIAIGVGLVGVAGLLRAGAPGAALLVLLTWPVGIGMGLAGAIAPVAVKERFSDRPATATGVYTTGIQIGSALAAALAVPLAAALGGWRASLAAFSAASCLLLVAWVALTAHEPPHRRPEARPPRLPWGDGTAWLLVALFGAMASAFYGINAWLPDAYAERGWSEARAGALLAVLNTVAIVASLVVPWLSDRSGRRRPWLVATAASFLVGALGFVLLPAAGFLWAAAVGVSSGALFALVMTLPLDLEHGAARVGALVGMMLGLGYTIGAVSPFVLGALRDASGSFTAPLWVVVAFCLCMLAAVLALGRRAAAATA